MPIAVTYPGVYIEEVPSGVRTITGVSTSVAAFIGYFKRGSTEAAVQVFNFTEFTREFGGLDQESDASYAVQQFFLTGGSEAWIVRATADAKAAAISIKDKVAGGTKILTATARSAGEWGNQVRLAVDYDTTSPNETFNLTVSELVNSGGQLVAGQKEVFRNLVLDDTKPNDARRVINDGSKLIRLNYEGTVTPAQRPAHSGTISKMLKTADLAALAAGQILDVKLNTTPAGTVTLPSPLQPFTNLGTLAGFLTAGLRKDNPPLQNASVQVMGSAPDDQYLLFTTGSSASDDVLEFSNTLATALGLDAAARVNVGTYALGGIAKAAQDIPGAAAQPGTKGTVPLTATDIAGDPIAKTGLFGLDAVDIFNLLCIPDTMKLSDTGAADVVAKAEAYCQLRRAFYILDLPQKDALRDEVNEVKAWLDANASLRHKNAALYYPRPLIADPLDEFRLRLVAPSGLLAGLYARTDTERGVWKAPAGTEATLRGVQALERTLTDAENGTLNPKAINCLRRFPIHGMVSWGARTLVGADVQASEWKYIPVRRTALFLEESLFRGTQWVVFEPNDEPLWAQIRLNVGAFMQTLFRQGAFKGASAREAYFVKCDSETTTQNDIDLGIVNILVGFAPLKPAEFVVIKIQQIAGEIVT